MEKDYAIIVGLQNYPGLDDPANGQPPLSGAENDAKDFKEWVASKDGGDVPEENISIILSSQYPSVFPSILKAKPAELEVAEAFEKLREISGKNIQNGDGPRVGRRLYIFMSGHGITPTNFGTVNEREAALLMANVDLSNISAPRYHIPGAYAATWFCKNECFDEVFLFMDCCRDVEIVPSINIFFPSKGTSDTAKWFYAFATRWSRRAREKPMKDEQGNVKVSGIFTKTLLLGLNGAAAERHPDDPEKGIITGASLRSYLYQNMKTFIDPQFRDEPRVQEPDVDYAPKGQEGRDIIIKEVALKKFPVVIEVPAGASGEITVMDDKLDPVHQVPVDTIPTELPINLPRGKYVAVVNINNSTKRNKFDVTGIENATSKRVVKFIA